MAILLHFWDLITSDPMTLAAASVLAVAVLGLVVVLSLPSSNKANAVSRRSAQARALVASGASAVDVARKTGLSRDALALMVGSVGPAARQKAPGTARVAIPKEEPSDAPSPAEQGQATA